MKSTLCLGLLGLAAAAPLVGQSVRGVWKPVEVVVDSGLSRGRHTTDVQPGLLIFTQRHYSMVFVQGFAPRPQLTDSAGDAELGRVFSPFTANSGTYQHQDSTVTFTPLVAKVPSVMAGNSYTLKIRVKADTLWVFSGPGAGLVGKWVRAER